MRCPILAISALCADTVIARPKDQIIKARQIAISSLSGAVLKVIFVAYNPNANDIPADAMSNIPQNVE
ncbi:hypothetical protein MASR2M70_17360 [Bacillota bacterium]